MYRYLILSFFFILISLSNVFAEDLVVVETNPRNPIKGEVFQILFKCKTTGNAEPEINFRADGFEVLGKQIQGLSTRTVYQNGKLSVSRELLVSYDAKAEKVGVINLRDVEVKIDGQVIREASVPIQVMSAPPEPKLIFIAADVPKKSVYVGEGITVRYYLYKKTGLQAFDIKKYPKLDGFMKRYLQENENTQRVTIDGELFGRSTIYSARLYPERSGKLIIDPMDISATYAQDLFGNMGFGFGLGMRDLKTKTFSSEPVAIEVKPLPEAGKPKSFMGLVGKHQFDLKVGRNQVLVNEPMEAKVTISGPGNLENLEAPDLWTVPQLEKFDAKADLSLIGSESAIKSFDYTYLGKANGSIGETKIDFSYFDPESGRYETESKMLPPLVVAGGKNTDAPETNTPIAKKVDKDIEKENDQPSQRSGTSVQPIWQKPLVWWSLLILVILSTIGFKAKTWIATRSNGKPAFVVDLEKIESGAFGSSELVRVLYGLGKDNTKTVRQVLAQSALSDEAKQYFNQLLEQVESAEYNRGQRRENISVDKKMLKELRNTVRG